MINKQRSHPLRPALPRGLPPVLTLAIFAAFAHGQAYSQFAQRLHEPGCFSTSNLYSKRLPVIADILLQTTSTTPWGTFTQQWEGKYWRSRDRNWREDDAFGTTLLLGVKARTWLDREAKLAFTDVWPEGTGPGKSKEDSSGQYRMLAKGVLSGRKVTGWVLAAEDPMHYECWEDDRLGVAIQIRFRSDTVETTQELENIQEREPDPEVFKIPEGYKVLDCAKEPKKAGEGACGIGLLQSIVRRPQ
jgi:hypothetical protein